MATVGGDQAIEVDGLAFAISPRGMEALLRGEGIQLDLSGLNIHLSEAALNAIFTRLAPADQPDALRIDLSSDRLVIDRREEERTFHLDVGLRELRLRISKDDLHLTTG